MSQWRASAKNQAPADGPLVRKVINLNETAMAEATKGSDLKESLTLLEQAEDLLVKESQRTGLIDPKNAGLFLVTWNNLCILHKKMMDYLSCLKRLMAIQKAELAVGSTRLEIATTKLNLGTCCHFLEQPADGLFHSNSAIDVLQEEVERTQKDQRIDQAYKKKLYLNLVLGHFNRAVQFMATGQEAQFKVNINQSLELATQKFGKDQPIYQMITANASKPPNEMKPFFVSKNPDTKEIYTQCYLLNLSGADFGVQLLQGSLHLPANEHQKPIARVNSSGNVLENSAVHSSSGRSSQGRQTGSFPVRGEEHKQSRSIEGRHSSTDNFTLNPKISRSQESFGEAKVPIKAKSLTQGSGSIPFQKYTKLGPGERIANPVLRSISGDQVPQKGGLKPHQGSEKRPSGTEVNPKARIQGGSDPRWPWKSAQTGLDSPMETNDKADSEEQTFRESWQAASNNKQESQSKSSNLSTQVTSSFLIKGTPRAPPSNQIEVFDGFFVGKIPPPKKTFFSVGTDAPVHKQPEEVVPYGSWVKPQKQGQITVSAAQLSNPAIKSLLRHMK